MREYRGLAEVNKDIDSITEASINVISKPVITGPTKAKYDTTITLTALGSLSAFKDDGAVIGHYEWILPDNSTETGNSINYTMPDNSHLGEVLTFKCRAVDSLGNVSSWSEFTVEVSDNLPPEISSIDRSDVLMGGSSYTFTINASDPEGSDLQYKITCSDLKVTISPSDWSSGNSFTVTLSDYESDTPVVFIYHVNDGTAEVTQAEEIVICNNNDVTTLALIDSDSNIEQAQGITVDSKGNIFACGQVDYDLFLFRAFNNFKDIKQITIDSGTDNDYFYGIITDTNDNIFVCGKANNYPYIGKFDNNIGLIKQITVDSSNRGEFDDIDIDSNGNIFACGYWFNSDNSNNNFYIGKFDGNINPVKQITADPAQARYLYGIAIDSNGNVFVCGRAYGSSYWLLYLAKFDNGLNLVKQITVDTGNTGNLRDIAIDSNGNVFVCGDANNGRLYIGKFSNDLNSIKQIIIDTTGYSAYGIYIDFDDNVYVAGKAANSFWVAKFDNDLNCLKQVIIRPKDFEGVLFDVFVDNKKNVYACGYKSDSNNDKQDIFITKLTDFINYDGIHGYLLGPYLFIKRDVNYTFVEQSYTVTEQSYTFTEQSWSVTEQAWTPEEKDFFVMIDHD